MIFIANWKMCLTPTKAVKLTDKIIEKFDAISQQKISRIILCPSFSSLLPVAHLLEKTSLSIGAQNCSAFEPGAYTGQESIKTLQEIGCLFCIIGHSEQRTLNFETSEQIAQKMTQLLSHKITPVICIGENANEFKDNKTKFILLEQLLPIFSMLKKTTIQSIQQIIIAYEPIWSIGTGLIPDRTFLVEIFEYLDKICTQTMSNKSISWQFIYGGSVKSTNAQELASIPGVGGFLIGGASLDSQEFEKIVHYSYL